MNCACVTSNFDHCFVETLVREVLLEIAVLAMLRDRDSRNIISMSHIESSDNRPPTTKQLVAKAQGFVPLKTMTSNEECNELNTEGACDFPLPHPFWP